MTSADKERRAFRSPHTMRPGAFSLAREHVGASKGLSSDYDEDALEDSYQSSDNLGTDSEAHYVDEEAIYLETSSEEPRLAHRPRLPASLKFEGESRHSPSTQAPEKGDNKLEDASKTDASTGEPLIHAAIESDRIRPFRQKLSSTISGDRSRGSDYEQYALFLKALAHPTAKNPQSEKTVQAPHAAQAAELAEARAEAQAESETTVEASEATFHPLNRSGSPALQDNRMELSLSEQEWRDHQRRQDLRARDAQRLAQDRRQYEKAKKAEMSWQQRQLPGGSSTSGSRHSGTYRGEDLIRSIADALGIPLECASSPESLKFYISDALGVPLECAASLESLKSYISDLQQHDGSGTLLKSERYQVIHRTGFGHEQRLYLDRPRYLQSENTSQRVIAGNLPISNLASYLSKHVEICFVVFRDYDATTGNDRNASDDFSDSEIWPEQTAETARLVRKSLTDTYNRFLTYSGFSMQEKDRDGSITLEAPYFAVYNKRQHGFEGFVATLDQKHQSTFLLLVDYILDKYGQEWDEVENLIVRGKITPRYIQYLFRPGELIVQENEHGVRGYLATSWLEGPKAVTGTRAREPLQNYHSSDKMQKRMEYTIEASSWEFDRSFSYRQKGLNLQLERHEDRELNVADLELRPLTMSAPEVQERLRSRGLMFWKCRLRYFVSYHEDPNRTSHHSGDDRYMIDTSMYQELCKRQTGSMHAKNQVSAIVGRDDLGHEFMENEEPPSDEDIPGFIFLMPITIKGFNLKSKKWLDLKVDNIGEVVWNDEAFKSLVLKEKTKDLIQALISNQIEAEKSTDLISGKGNGLIMLLHGGPGTGKTLTAESVAEIARKPLYPVTCGDIGTEADQVEAYLESVLYIGRTWGCVVLMDEADVFLQERNLKDLQRNALVSVFLRVLEYYDGILVLTSNRVGHFDAAFKSRIQLAVRYPPLDEHQRTQIWGSFIRRLQTFNEGDIDISDLVDHIPELAKNKMNGREIRNVITTARQFAKWKRQCPGSQHRQLDYAMMKEIIEVSGEFDKYLENELYDGNTLEQIARERLDH